MAKNTFDGYIDQIGDAFNKLPTLPKGGRDFVVAVLPWLALIFGILGAWGAVASLGWLGGAVGYFGVANLGGAFMVAVILGLVSSILLLASFVGLKNKQEKGWKLAFYSEVVALVSSIIFFSLGGVLVALIGFYLLYQVRSYYK